jgi:hypothetical protein
MTCAASRVGLSLLVASFLAGGCRSQQAATKEPANPMLHHLQSPPNAAPADVNRAALARFVGVWNFEGWTADRAGQHMPRSGRAAGAIDHEHFVEIEFHATDSQPGGSNAHKAVSVLLASEPGLGLTMTAWGDASPAVSRLIGKAEGDGSAFTFDEATSTAGRDRLSVTIKVQTDDHWTLEVHDASNSGRPVVASYAFTRAPR